MDLERARVLVDRDDEEIIEPLVIRGNLEPLPRRKDGDGGNPGAPFACAVASQGVTRVCRKEVACNLRAAATASRDDGRPLRHAWIGVVDDHGFAGCETRVDQLLLAALGLTIVAHGVLADQGVRRRKAFTIERALAGRRQADQDYAFQ